MSTSVAQGRLTRTSPVPPVRIVHIGLGAFSRSHTAWYTAQADGAAEWGIAAYTGRSTALSNALTAQGGLYTLIERSSDGDSAAVVESIARAHAGDDWVALVADIAAETTAVVTLTITEAGYRTIAEGEPDLRDPLVVADIAALRILDESPNAGGVVLATPLGRLVWGLELRRRTHSSPLAIVSCDNLPDNGGHVRRGVIALARLTMPATAQWCENSVSFVSSSVDRITPQISIAELAELSERYDDLAPVIAEPFHDWVISGDFPHGRPLWESAGARFTDDLEPWEARKLWMLNGAHTLLANLGQIRGHSDVARAIQDPVCRKAVEAFWDEAQRHLPEQLEVASYRSALLERFANPRIRHRLAQIASDTPMKLQLRVAPVAEREREAGRSAAACATILAAWMAADELGMSPIGAAVSAGSGSAADVVTARVGTISPSLASDGEFCLTVASEAESLLSEARRNFPANHGNRLSN